MKYLAAIFKIFLPPAILTAVWIFGWRPATTILDLISHNTVSPTVEGTLNVAVLSSLVSFVQYLWSSLAVRPIVISTTLENLSTRRRYSVFQRQQDEQIEIRLTVLVTVKHNFAWVLKFMNGIILTMKDNQGVLSYNFDFIKHKGDPGRFSLNPIGIMFFHKGYSVHTTLAEEFKMLVGSDLTTIRSVEFQLHFVPNCKNRLTRLLATFVMKCIILEEMESHKLDFED